MSRFLRFIRAFAANFVRAAIPLLLYISVFTLFSRATVKGPLSRDIFHRLDDQFYSITPDWIADHKIALPFSFCLGLTVVVILAAPPSLLLFNWRTKNPFPIGIVVGGLIAGTVNFVLRRSADTGGKDGLSRRLTQFALSYKDQNAVQVSLKLDAFGPELNSIVDVKFEIPACHLPTVSSSVGVWFDLFDVWIEWPPTLTSLEIEQNRIDRKEWRLPLAVDFLEKSEEFEFQSKSHMEIVDEHGRVLSGFTRFAARRIRAQSQEDIPLEIKAKVSNCATYMPARIICDQKRLTISWRSLLIREGSPGVIATVDRPRSFRLLWRNDNSEYMSLSSDVDKDHSRYTLFFPARDQKIRECKAESAVRDGAKSDRQSLRQTEYADMRLRMTLFHGEYSSLIEPAFPLFNAGLGLIVIGISIHLIGQGREAPFFALVSTALTLIVLFGDGIRRRRVFMPSASMTGFTLNGTTLLGSAFVFLLYFAVFVTIYDFDDQSATTRPDLATAATYPFTKPVESIAASVGSSDHSSLVLGLLGVWLGTAMLALSLRYMTSVQLGRVQGYRCDSCERPFRSRQHRISLQPLTRKAFCQECGAWEPLPLIDKQLIHSFASRRPTELRCHSPLEFNFLEELRLSIDVSICGSNFFT